MNCLEAEKKKKKTIYYLDGIIINPTTNHQQINKLPK